MPSPIVAGNSYGGLVALQLAAARPAERLVLLSPAFDHEPSARFRAFIDAENAALAEGRIDDAVELNVQLWAPTGHEALVRDMQARIFGLQLDVEDEEEEPDLDLAAVTAPAIVVYGTHDLEDFTGIARHLAAELPDARLHALPAGHLSPLELPGDVAGLIRGDERRRA